MNTVTLGVSSRDAIKDRFVRAMQGEKQGNLIKIVLPYDQVHVEFTLEAAEKKSA